MTDPATRRTTGTRRRRTLSTAVLAAATLVAGFAATVVAADPAAAAYVPHSALIDGDSVSTGDGITDSGGNPISLEQYAAERAGFTVTVVDGATWNAMTAAQFGNYQLLIIGDPMCGEVPLSATDNSSTWAPVVMGHAGGHSTAGNRSLVGTDPEFHYAFGGGGAQPTDPSDPSTAGAEHLVEAGITYAGGVDGATGIYFDTSCFDNGQSLDTLNRLTTAGTGFTSNTSPPCGGSVQLIASNPAFAMVTDHDIQGWGCSDHTTYPTYPTDWQPLAVATDAPTQPTCGTDPDTNTTACGESYVLVAGVGIVVTSPNLALTPATHSDPVGGSHTVTATVKQGSTPLGDVLVSFSVTGQNVGASGTCAPVSCKTDSSGQVTFTYADANGAGTDTINASATISGSTEHATASETWVCPTSTPSMDVHKFVDSASAASLSATGVSTGAAKELVVAAVEAGGPVGQAVTSVTGGGLTWKLAKRSHANGGTTEIWFAHAYAKLSSATIKATLAKAGYKASLSVVSFRNATGIGATSGASGSSSVPATTLTPKASKSVVWAAAHGWGTAATAVPASGQAIAHQYADSAGKAAYWTQFVSGATTSGHAVKVTDSNPSGGAWSVAAVEVLGGATCSTS